MLPALFSILASQSCGEEGNGAHEIKLVLEEGKLTGLQFNGKAVPLERFSIQDGEIRLYEEDGSLLCVVGAPEAHDRTGR